MNYAEINLELLNADEIIITNSESIKIIESIKNKIIKIDFMNRFEFVYDLNNKENIGFNILNDGISITMHTIDNITSLKEFIEYIKGEKNDNLMCLLLNFVAADLTKSIYDNPDKELIKFLELFKVTDRERLDMEEWYKEYLDSEIRKIEVLRKKGYTDREILDINQFSFTALNACNLPISYLMPRIEGQEMTLQEWDTHTSYEHKWGYFNGVPFGNPNERDRVLIGLIYSAGLKHLLEILPQSSKEELYRLAIDNTKES